MIFLEKVFYTIINTLAFDTIIWRNKIEKKIFQINQQDIPLE